MYYYDKLQRLMQEHHQMIKGTNKSGSESEGDETTDMYSDDEVNQLIKDYQRSFPLPYFLLVCGYAFILLIDKVIIDSQASVAPPNEAYSTLDKESTDSQQAFQRAGSIEL